MSRLDERAADDLDRVLIFAALGDGNTELRPSTRNCSIAAGRCTSVETISG